MLNLEKQKIDERKKELVNLFLNTKTEKYILGQNNNAEKLLNTVKDIDGIIDDYTKEKEWKNEKILKHKDIKNKTAIIVSCSLAIYPYTALNALHKEGFSNVITILDIVKFSDLNLDIQFLSKANEDIENSFQKYNKIYNLIKEKESKKVFSDIINFRYSFSLSFMKYYKVDSIGQYFEDFLNLDNEVFVDAGAYDGQTSLEFIKHCPNYKSVYLFEPSESNLKLAKENLKSYRNINFITKGLSNKKDTLKFDTESGSASSISENGTVAIDVDTLDTLVDEKVTFIKMDIEGAEGMAIEGMKEHIKKDYPKMAISVYHKVDDFWKIPEQIFAIRSDYDIYMRHYTEGTDETVMFFMPSKIRC